MSLAVSSASPYLPTNLYLAIFAEIDDLIESEDYPEALSLLSTIPTSAKVDEYFRNIALKTNDVFAADKIFNLILKKQTIKEIETRATQCTLI